MQIETPAILLLFLNAISRGIPFPRVFANLHRSKIEYAGDVDFDCADFSEIDYLRLHRRDHCQSDGCEHGTDQSIGKLGDSVLHNTTATAL